MSIEEWLEELEADRDLSIEEFYAHVVRAKHVLQERLESAASDGVDLEALPEIEE